MRFKIKNIAIGTRDLPWTQADILLSMGDYVETAIEYNNDFLVSKYLPKNKNLITRLFDTDNYEYLLNNHLGYLERERVDILLIPVSGLPEIETWKKLYEYTKNVGLFGATIKPEDLDRYKELYGIFPEYISIPLNPYNFKKDLIDKAIGEGIKIISYEIFGGPLEAKKMLGTFGIQFLARFASYYSDIVCISSAANLEDEMVLTKTLSDIIDTDVTDNTKYQMNMSTSPKSLGVQRKIYTYSEVSISGKNHIFRNDYNGYIGAAELLISFQKSLESIPTLDMEDLKEEDNILIPTAIIMGEIVKVEAPKWKEEVSAFYRYLVERSLHTIYSGYRYKFNVSKVGQVFRISIVDRLKFWKKSIEYILVISERFDGGYNVFFRNL